MKEIIKYLRTINSFTQDEVAQKLEITRQSYIKYENGTVVPSAKTVQKIADIYGVTTTFIYENKVPKIQLESQDRQNQPFYKIDKNMPRYVDEPSPEYSARPNENTIVYDAYFDGTAVRVLDDNFSFSKGQHFKIVVDADKEIEKRREESKKVILDFIGKLREYPKDYDYREEYHRYLEEKYVRTDRH